MIGIIKSRRIGLAGHTADIGRKRNACRVTVGESECNRPLGRHKLRLEDDVKSGFYRNRMSWYGVD
jgi:hypothetical protein